MDSFEKHLQLYRQEHSALGCKLTHMFGIPIIVVSLPMVIFNWQLGLAMFIMSWILQFVGHYVFQRNHPVFMKARATPGPTPLASCLFPRSGPSFSPANV